MEGEGIYPGIPLKIGQGVVSPASSFGKNKSAGNSLNCPILCGQYKKAPWQEILSF